MSNNIEYDSLLNEAKHLFAAGHDNKYIEFQLADKGVDDSIIDRIIFDINLVRKSNKRRRGMKLAISGASSVAVAFLITMFSFGSGSSIGFIMWGLAIGGILTLIKGVADILDL